MRVRDTNEDPAALALRALTWALGEPDRAARFLSITGLDPADLRARAGSPEVLVAALGFLEAHEADLVACAHDLDVTPESLVSARERLDA
jgi:hypothetical protein